MEGLSQNIGWFDENVSNKLREFTQTGAECVYGKSNVRTECMDTARKDVNELVRHLYDLMKPQFYEVKSKSNVHKST